MTSTTKWEKVNEMEIRGLLFRYIQKCKGDYSGSTNPSDEIIDYIQDLLTSQSNELVSKINKVLKQGHGGGNWKRLIIQLKALVEDKV